MIQKIKLILKENVKKISYGLFIMLILSFFVPIKFIIFLVISTFFNAIVAKFNLMNGLPTEFELSTFSTILISSVYGLEFGIFNAIMSKIIANLYTGSFIVDHIFMISNYCLAAYLAHILIFNIVYVGIIITLLNNILMFTISKYILGITLPSNISYAFSNSIMNICLFLAFAEPILFLLK